MLSPNVLVPVYMTLAARLQVREQHPATPRTDVATPNMDTPADTKEAARAFAENIETWPPFPDTVPALASRAPHFRPVVLSNIDRATIAKTRGSRVTSRRLRTTKPSSSTVMAHSS